MLNKIKGIPEITHGMAKTIYSKMAVWITKWITEGNRNEIVEGIPKKVKLIFRSSWGILIELNRATTFSVMNVILKIFYSCYFSNVIFFGLTHICTHIHRNKKQKIFFGQYQKQISLHLYILW